MEVNDQLIDKLSHLARLQFKDEEKDEIKRDLEKMIGFVEKLKEVDTTGIEPLLHMSDGVNILREDDVKTSISREEALKNAPDHDENFFRTPKVIRNPNLNNPQS